MPATTLCSRPPNSATPASPRAPETDAERRARHLDMLREMADLAMAIARDAAAKATSPDPTPPDAPDPGLTFARATRAARQAIALESSIAAGDLRQPRPANDPAAAPDPRRALLRQALHKAARSEPNRPALRREIDAGIERELGADPEAEIATGEILAKLSGQLGLPFDSSLLPDHFLTVGPTRSRDPSCAPPDGAGPQATKPTTSWTAQHIRDPDPAASAPNPTHADPPKPTPFHRRE